MADFFAWVSGLGSLGPFAFVAGYALAVVALVPASLLTLAAGALFGLVRGTLLVLVAATLGATAAFLLARHGARRLVERRLSSDTRLAALDRAIAQDGFRLVLLLRLSPVVPFSVLNYALGLTRVRLRDYVLASVGMVPGTLLYVWSGKLAGDVARAAAGGVVRGPAYWTLLGVGLLATLGVVLLVTRAARRALAEASRVEA